MHTVSMADTAFSDGMRRDIWHHDMMIAVAILMKWQPYPACPTCIFNLAGCTFRENVYIESLDPALISCLGTIDTETDSVRKYVNQQY